MKATVREGEPIDSQPGGATRASDSVLHTDRMTFTLVLRTSAD